MDNTEFQNPSLTKPASKSRRPIFWLIIAIVVIILIFAGFKFLGSKSQKSEQVEITPTPTEIPTPTETPTPTSEETPTPKPTSTPTPKPTVNPVDKTTGLDRSSLSVVVENGSGEAGVAAKAADFLRSLGYNVVSTGNADNFDYTNVTIQVKSASSDFLSLLKNDLSANYTVGASSSDLSASSSADALVIVGK